MKIEIKEIKDTQAKREHGNVRELADSIQKEGLLQPLVINQDNQLICGRRRFDALKLLGIKEVAVHKIKTADDIDKLSKAIAENIIRKNLTWQEEISAKEELDRLMRLKHGEAIKGRRTDIKPTATSAVGWSTGKTAKLLNEPERTTQTDIKLSKAIKENPELKKCKTKKGALRELKIKKQRERLEDAPPSKPSGLYDIIVIDPPWEMEGTYSPEGRRGIPPYPTMTIDRIKKIKIPAKKDCILWLWVTNRKMKYAFEILESWGFEDRNILTWVKNSIGVGDWLRNQTEHCILAIKGKPFFNAKSASTVINAKKGSHSAKPDEFFEMVDKVCAGEKLEYFSRKKREGWDSYGDEL